MNQEKNTQNKRKLGKGGFSLVELIIVIAIMAILVGAVAPQVIKYVEKARESKDIQILSTVATAVQTAMAGTTQAVGAFTDINIDNDTNAEYLKIKAEVKELLGENKDTDTELNALFASKKGRGTTANNILISVTDEGDITIEKSTLTPVVIK